VIWITQENPALVKLGKVLIYSFIAFENHTLRNRGQKAKLRANEPSASRLLTDASGETEI
jgi:hypothetical protein